MWIGNDGDDPLKVNIYLDDDIGGGLELKIAVHCTHPYL